MNRNVVKLIALLLMLSLVLTGCGTSRSAKKALKEVEAAKQELVDNYSVSMADYDGGSITKFDMMATFYNNYNYINQLYSMMGTSVDTATLNSLVSEAVTVMLQNRAIQKEFEARGLSYGITDEELAAEIEATYDSCYSYYFDYTQSNYGGTNADILKANTELFMYMQGYDRAYIEDMVKANYRIAAVQEAVMNEVTEITDADMEAYYANKLMEDEEKYASNTSLLESNATNADTVITWYPEGYRTVKHVLVIPEDDVMTAVTDARDALNTAQTALSDLEAELSALNDDDVAAEETAESEEAARTTEDIQKDIDAKAAEIPALETAVAEAEAACLASVKEKTDAIYADFEAGKDINEIMAAYGEDPGMQSEPAMTTGYFVCAASTRWDKNFAAEAMALEKVGDYSATPVISTSGVHIVYYASDVTPGAVALDDIKDAIYDAVLTEKREAYFTTELDRWVEEMNPVLHLDVWQF